MLEDAFRDRLAGLVDEVSTDMNSVYSIERQGVTVAVLIGFDAYQHLCTALKHWESI